MDETLTLEQWYELESRIRQQYPELTDDDLQYHEAVEQDMIKMVEFSVRKVNEGMQGFIDRHFGISSLKFNWRRTRNTTRRIRQRI
jgi:hypothetical protein